jgi:bifunctional non-homologous end joining protein LigD
MVAPMKAVTGDLPSDDDAWAFEIKWDGYRTIAHVDGGHLRLQNIKQPDVTARYPELAGLGVAVNAPSAVLDGEVVVIGPDGRPSFGLIQLHELPASYVLFDVLEVGGQDTTGLAYERRRALLADLVEPGPTWRVGDWEVGGGSALFEATAALDLEGVVAKRLGSTYQPGRRSPSWRKVKHRKRQEVVVGGFTKGEGGRSSTFGALLVGVYDGPVLRFAGAVGTGFDQRLLEDLTGQLRAMVVPDTPFAAPVGPAATHVGWRQVVRTATWVRPELVAEVAFAEWTSDGVLRHPAFIGLRDDKDATEVVREP